MEEYSGAYMRLLHNVFRVDRASLVLASDTRTTPVQADRDVTHHRSYSVSNPGNSRCNHDNLDVTMTKIWRPLSVEVRAFRVY